MVRLKGKVEIRARMCDFPEIQDGSPRNAAMSTGHAVATSGENGSNLADR